MYFTKIKNSFKRVYGLSNEIFFFIIAIGKDDLTPDGDGVGNAGARIACGLILEPSEEGMGVTILIIILVVVAILVIALLICICCYYCKK